MAHSDHPTSPDLLLWHSGELGPEQAAALKAHLAACPVCQAKLAELESLYVRIAVVDNKAAEYRMRESPQSRPRNSWRRLTHPPRWASAIATIVIVALIVSSVVDLTPAARAETLLSKAVKEQSAEGQHPRFLRVTSAGLECHVGMGPDFTSSRLIVASESDFCAPLYRDLNSMGWSWNDLLSARSFLGWRDSRKRKKDTIQKYSDATEVTTTTPDGPLQRATLRLRSSDHRPVDGRFVFVDSVGREKPEVEVTESASLPPDLARNPPREPTVPHEALRPSAPVVDPLDAKEADVRLALHQLHADENILLSVVRASDRISVSGVVPSRGVEASIDDALRTIPEVDASVIAEGESQQASAATSWQPFRGDAPPLAYDRVNALYRDDPEGRQNFVNGLDAVTRRLVGEAKTRDALVKLAPRTRGADYSARIEKAAAELQADAGDDAASLAAQLQPIVGPIASNSKRLTYPRAMELYTLVHELVQLNRSDNALTLDEAVARIRELLSDR